MNVENLDIQLSKVFNKIDNLIIDKELTDLEVFDKLESLRVEVCFNKELIESSPKMLKVIDGYISYLQESLV